MVDLRYIKNLTWYEWIMAAVMIGIAGYVMLSSFLEPSSSDNPTWLTVVNFVSAVAGVFCIFLTAKAHISNFVFGIVNTISYMIYLAYWQIYGTFLLEMLVYLPVSIISWVMWVRHRDRKDRALTKSKKMPKYAILLLAGIVAVSGLIYGKILEGLGDPVPMLDAYTVAIGLVAISLELLRYREQYILWLITDVIAVAMFMVHFDPVYLTKKMIYLIMAFVGLYNWCKLARERNPENE
ncbi:MAG: nicotinamide mononucleotide transporter [Prevotella sp.]|nr:nicotinamide mononucleotide transporter [Prevotella sp.]